ncbi:MAG TPA: ABC transporter permease [Pseudolabrys sp.]|nr:ABC transporter permease [Pseudolabrys sp.]
MRAPAFIDKQETAVAQPAVRVNGWGIATVVYAVAFYIFLYGPIVMIGIFSFNKSEVTGLPFTGATTRWYEVVFARADLMAALFNSITLGIVSATIATTLAFFLGLAFRRDFVGKRLVLGLVLLPIIMPGIVGGIVLLIFFGYLGIRSGLYTTVLAAHINWVLPFAFLTLNGRLQGLDKAVEEAAMDLGARSYQVLTWVILPIVRPALVATLLFSFSLSFDEFIRTLFVTGYDRTVPVVFWGAIVDRLAPELPAMAIITILISTAASLCGFAFASRSRANPA